MSVYDSFIGHDASKSLSVMVTLLHSQSTSRKGEGEILVLREITLVYGVYSQSIANQRNDESSSAIMLRHRVIFNISDLAISAAIVTLWLKCGSWHLAATAKAKLTGLLYMTISTLK